MANLAIARYATDGARPTPRYALKGITAGDPQRLLFNVRLEGWPPGSILREMAFTAVDTDGTQLVQRRVNTVEDSQGVVSDGGSTTLVGVGQIALTAANTTALGGIPGATVPHSWDLQVWVQLPTSGTYEWRTAARGTVLALPEYTLLTALKGSPEPPPTALVPSSTLVTLSATSVAVGGTAPTASRTVKDQNGNALAPQPAGTWSVNAPSVATINASTGAITLQGGTGSVTVTFTPTGYSGAAGSATFTVTGAAAQAAVGKLVGDGNSLLAGVGIDASFTSYLPGNIMQLLGARYSAPSLNFAVSGQTTQDMTSDASTQIDPAFNASLGNNVLVLWELRNDYVGNAKVGTVKTAQAVLDALWTYVDARRTAHAWATVVVLPVLPTTDTETGSYTNAAFETWRQDINTKLAAQAAAHGCRVAQLPATLMAAGSQANTTYYRDGIHLTGAGYALAEPYVAAEINSALGATDTTTASVTVTPTGVSLAVGATQTFAFVAKNAAGQTLTGKTATWSSSASGVMSMNSSTGVGTGVAAGSAQARATVDGIVGAASVTVTAGADAFLSEALAALGGTANVAGFYDFGISSAVTLDGAGTAMISCADARGSGFGPTLTAPSTAERPSFDAATNTITGGGSGSNTAKRLLTAADANFRLNADAAVIMLYAAGAGTSSTYTGGLTNGDDISRCLLIERNAAAFGAHVVAVAAGGAGVAETITAGTGTIRLVVASQRASTIAIQVPNHAEVTASQAYQASGACSLQVLGYANGVTSDDAVRAVIICKIAPTSTQIGNLMTTAVARRGVVAAS